MSTFLDLAGGGAAWLGVNVVTVLLVLASLTLISLIFPIRPLSIASIVTLAIGVLLYQQGLDRSALGLLLMTIAVLLISIERGMTLRRLRNIDHSLAATIKSVRELQAAHERRQGFIARKMLPRISMPPERERDGMSDPPDTVKRHVMVEEHATDINDMRTVNRDGS
jgi:hypothetical protein